MARKLVPTFRGRYWSGIRLWGHQVRELRDALIKLLQARTTSQDSIPRLSHTQRSIPDRHDLSRTPLCGAPTHVSLRWQPYAAAIRSLRPRATGRVWSARGG
jgi:hypothetical protein